ncbi:SAM-dependent methyltransferase [Kitasatospora sp. MAP12-15]|uniref:SAM-dependent methyltransferase n=1 Tax=unclassified Kitasatospora TaxID=2633591 RepID=UPI002475FF5E|nr:SAM-dependent methyltransferase [Kitasatospora sp. MAP12-44]MDH6111400.1 SAM-dependent methyltransferase [Kitasatospora sp. MAP12-44]
MTATLLRTPWETDIPGPDEFHGVELDMEKPQSARVEDYLLRGLTNFAADREAAGLIIGLDAKERTQARQRKGFRVSAMSYLAGLGVSQFVDVGCGLPLPEWWRRRHAHEVHQLAGPGSRVVHIDRDPIVMTHARALLAGCGPAAIGHLEADFTEPESVLEAELPLDLGQPVVLAFFDVLHEVEHARQVVAAYTDAVAPGSMLVISHRSRDNAQGRQTAAGHEAAGLAYTARSREEFTALFDGWHLLGPGIAPAPVWSASLARGSAKAAARASVYGAIAVKR